MVFVKSPKLKFRAIKISGKNYGYYIGALYQVTLSANSDLHLSPKSQNTGITCVNFQKVERMHYNCSLVTACLHTT